MSYNFYTVTWFCSTWWDVSYGVDFFFSSKCLLCRDSPLVSGPPTSRSDDLMRPRPSPCVFGCGCFVAVDSDASQTLRVGYGRFVSDLLGHVEKARATAGAGMGASTGTAEAGGGAVRAGRQRAERGEQQPRVEDGTEARAAGNLPNPGGPAGGGPAVSTTGSGAEAVALGGLQRFGGECLRSLAEGAAFA